MAGFAIPSGNTVKPNLIFHRSDNSINVEDVCDLNFLKSGGFKVLNQFIFHLKGWRNFTLRAKCTQTAVSLQTVIY